MNQTADLVIIDFDAATDCPIVGPFLAQQTPECRSRVLATVRGMKPCTDDHALMLRRLLYLLEVTTGFVVIAGCKSGSLPRVSNGLVSMRDAMRGLRHLKESPPGCFAPDFDALGILAVETGRLFAVCVDALTVHTHTRQGALDLCLSVFETVAAIE